MIKGQDIVLLVKLITNKESRQWGQLKLSQHLCMSSSTVNASLKRLERSQLIVYSGIKNQTKNPIQVNCKEFILCSGYIFVAKTSYSKTSGILSYTSAPVFKAANLIPDYDFVWPDAEGNARGIESEPLHPMLAKSLRLFPDKPFYEMLCLIEGLRFGTIAGCRAYSFAREQLTKRIEECL